MICRPAPVVYFALVVALVGLLLAAAYLFVVLQSRSLVLDRLQGTWISDREGTVAALREDGHLSPERIEQLEPLFGKMVIAYDGKNVAIQMGDFRSEGIVVFRNEDGNRAEVGFLKSGWHFFLWKEDLYSKIEVYDDHYWLIVGESPAFRERFVRLKAEPQPSPEAAATPEPPAAPRP